VFTGFWLGGLKGRDHWEDLGIGGRITLRCRWDRARWGELDLADSWNGPVVGFCEHVNEPSGCIIKAQYCLPSWVTISFSKNILHHGVSKEGRVSSRCYLAYSEMGRLSFCMVSKYGFRWR
jgi:hypothetical protein